MSRPLGVQSEPFGAASGDIRESVDLWAEGRSLRSSLALPLAACVTSNEPSELSDCVNSLTS